MEIDSFYTQEKKYVLNSFYLKIIACLLMTLDHVALLFVDSQLNPDLYFILRAIGKISFPIFAYLSFESINRSKHPVKYLLTLLAFSLSIDIFGYIFSAIKKITISNNPFIGNVFTDLFLGTLTIYLLKKKNWISVFAVFPVAYAILSNLVISQNYGTLFKTDWGTFSICLFILFFITREAYHFSLIKKANDLNVDVHSMYQEQIVMYDNILASVSLVFNELLFYLIYKINNQTTFIPNEFVPIGTYSTLAIVFILLNNGKRGYDNKFIRYSFYCYYPLHLIILGIFSLFFGILKNF